MITMRPIQEQDLDAWIASRTSGPPCTVTSIVRLDGSHPTGILLATDWRPLWERGEPGVFWVRLDGETAPRQYQTHEVEF